jgi:hypothetical protein
MSSSDRDERLKNKGANDTRTSRDDQDRPVTENRVVSDDERLELFRSASFQHTLPEVPPLPGYHLCWLTTTNPRDSVMMRSRWGYEPVKSSEFPGYEAASVKTGEYAGCIGVNEMVLFKLPLRLYERYMNEMHHEQPLREESKLNAVLEVIAQQAREKGAHVEVGEGSRELGRAGRRPIFEEI